MNCKEDAIVKGEEETDDDTGSKFNVLPKSTLSRLSYQSTPMRYIGVIVKAFDGSRKTVIGEMDLLVKIGPSDFQITFQVMDIHLAYSCLLRRPWIHEVGAVTSILHQKLKFVKNDKLIVVSGEKALLITENKNRAELGFQPGPFNIKVEDVKPSFCSEGFIHGNEQHLNVVIEDGDDEDEACANFMTHGQTCNNWVVIDIPTIIHRSKLVLKPVEYNDPTPSPNFDFPVFEAEEESDDEEVSDELSRLLEHEEKAIQSFED
ncbi:hypothetical protein KIW84_012336 [Lathyrus oleraceus]|uniref:Uncharacterized protein n=1 Tax=Pisum sativum TaxID=3888 RepID=A0A9D5BH89_PEA|nr:hypothetical protein KIW84_012336 [Pisum sativum]